MPQTWGVPLEEIEKGIKNGVRKINTIQIAGWQ